MTTFAYLRVSTDWQKDKNGTDAQRYAIGGWLASKGLTIEPENWHEDLAESGASMDRPAWNALQARLVEGDVLVVYDLSRVARNVIGLMEWIAQMSERKIKAAVVKEGIDLGNATGVMLAQIMGSIAEWQRKNTARNMSDGIRARLARGEAWGGGRTKVNRFGSGSGCAKLSLDEWKALAARSRAGESYSAIARRHGLNASYVARKLARLKAQAH